MLVFEADYEGYHPINLEVEFTKEQLRKAFTTARDEAIENDKKAFFFYSQFYSITDKFPYHFIDEVEASSPVEKMAKSRKDILDRYVGSIVLMRNSAISRNKKQVLLCFPGCDKDWWEVCDSEQECIDNFLNYLKENIIW